VAPAGSREPVIRHHRSGSHARYRAIESPLPPPRPWLSELSSPDLVQHPNRAPRTGVIHIFRLTCEPGLFPLKILPQLGVVGQVSATIPLSGLAAGCRPRNSAGGRRPIDENDGRCALASGAWKEEGKKNDGSGAGGSISGQNLCCAPPGY